MGTQVLSLSRTESKPTYVASEVAFGSVAVADGQLAVFVGTNATAKDQVESFNGVMAHCLSALRDASWPNSTTGVVVEAIYDVVAQLPVAVLSEDTVAIIKGSDYTPAGVSCSAYVKRMAEVYLEDVGKVT